SPRAHRGARAEPRRRSRLRRAVVTHPVQTRFTRVRRPQLGSIATGREVGYPEVLACNSIGGSRGAGRSTPSPSSLRELALSEPEDRARDHQALDLARPLVDLGDLRVPVVALDRKLCRVAIPAEDLDRLSGLPTRHLRREQLRLRALLRVREP